MKEIFEFRISYDYAHLLFGIDEGTNLGTSVRLVELSKNDPRFSQIPEINSQIEKLYGKGFYYGWAIKRKYTKGEIHSATLFYMKIKTTFEPAGEECGTEYDESVACEICGTGRKQTSPLRLNRRSIPKKDLSRTIAGEIVVSDRFVHISRKRLLNGLMFEPVDFKDNKNGFYQLTATSELVLTKKTVVGDDPFYTSEGSEGIILDIDGYDIALEKEIYQCPKGHLLGLNLLSEPYVMNDPSISQVDFFSTKQSIGVKRGLLSPEPLYLCSQKFRKMVEEEKLTGIEFEIAHIDDTFSE